MAVQEYPRAPTPDEYEIIRRLVVNKQYPAGDSCAQERAELGEMLGEARDDGRFIVSYARSDSPGYWGRMIFMIWPDTSVTMYRQSPIELPSFNIASGGWYECDKDGMPWI